MLLAFFINSLAATNNYQEAAAAEQKYKSDIASYQNFTRQIVSNLEQKKLIPSGLQDPIRFGYMNGHIELSGGVPHQRTFSALNTDLPQFGRAHTTYDPAWKDRDGNDYLPSIVISPAGRAFIGLDTEQEEKIKNFIEEHGIDLFHLSTRD